ncbi:MAG: hypothetical protein GC203_17105 [Phenylobacterium sp.]|uniref:DUF6491 family protein n=1 Tax=Phenylobacterium sp. TaxID=1871053 RepID=UPI0025E2CCAB|nr:DUF6491 family protein [Phenylobacterium sp.]MBI1199582.1 hypothetical protein [Phenylobacterium sp.]
MHWKIALGLAAATLMSLGPAASAKTSEEAAAKPAKQCFWTRQVNSFASSDNHIVNLRVGVNDYYQLEMLGRCQDVDWNHKIALVSRGSDYICTGLDAEILSPTPIGPDRCPVKSIRKLTPDEVKALPKGARP